MTAPKVKHDARAVPPPPRTGNLELDRWLQQTHEASQVREGVSRKPEERFITAAELADTGLVQLIGGGRIAAPRGRQGTNPGDSAIDFGPPDLGQNDFTRPPTARNVRARGVGPNNIMVGWQIPAFTNAYYAEVFRTPTSDIGQLSASFDEGRAYNQSDNNTPFYRGRSFGNSFLDRLEADEEDGPWFYWVRFVTAALVPGDFNIEPAEASRNFEVEDWLENFSGTIPVLMDDEGNVGLRGDLVVGGMLTAQDADIRGLLTANEIWAKSIVGLEATFDNVVGSRIIVGPRYIQDGSGARILDPSDTPLNGTSGQWRLALNSPLSGYNVGTDGLVRIIHYYKPTFSGGVEAAVVPGSNEAFYLDNQGNVFVGGNLTIRTQGSPGMPANGVMIGMGFNGNGTNNAPYYRNGASLVQYPAYNRFALWIGRKSDYVNDGAREDNGILWIREGVNSDGDPVAGLNADFFFGDDPFSIPSGDGYITVLPRRDSPSAQSRVFLSGCVALAPVAELANCAYTVELLLVPASYAGGGSGVVRAGITKQAGIDNFVEVLETSTPPVISGGRLAASSQLDSRERSRDLKNISLQGSVMAPPGDYKVFMRLFWGGGIPGGSAPHGAFTAAMFGMQCSR